MQSPLPAVDPPRGPLRERALGIIALAALLGMLYFARDVLVPITLALFLSLLLEPLIRLLRRMGAGHTLAALLTVLCVILSMGAIAAIIGSQLVRLADSMPQYEKVLGDKVDTINGVFLTRFSVFRATAHRSTAQRGRPSGQAASVADLPPDQTESLTNSAVSIPVEMRDPQPGTLQVLQRVLGAVWTPLETAGIVIVALLFILLEQGALRDRFIRIAGGTDIRMTTLALNDAGERLSRFFVSQFAVNLGVGVMLFIGLRLVGLPHPLLWAVLAAVLRFVPYAGIWIAAFLAIVLAAAVDSSWSLTLATLGLFAMVEFGTAQIVEPQLYGHSTGLSPLSVFIAAIFWSWIWGPVGLVMSTPLTLCLLVAGRHIKALSLLDVLLGDAQALTLPQRLYQRALSADATDIIANARSFLKQNSFADYCDVVVLPALQLARLDVEAGAINSDQEMRIRAVMVTVIGAISAQAYRVRRDTASSVLAQLSAGQQLRQQREELSGRRRGPLTVPPGSVILGIGLGSVADDLATELLVRILCDQKLDARYVPIEDLESETPPHAAGAGLGSVCR